MTSSDLIVLNFEEIRRRSINLWNGIPPQFYGWRPDQYALTSLQMVRHVLETEYTYQKVTENRGSDGLDFLSPWKDKPYLSVADEIEFAIPYRKNFLEFASSFTQTELAEIIITRTERGQKRILGDYLLRIAYHEAVHSGQMLSYLRTLNIERPLIWD